MIEIYATYNGERFPVKIGGEYEFSNSDNFEDAKTSRLASVMNAEHAFVTYRDYCYKYIRPIQPKEVKPLTHKEIDMNLVGKGKFKHIYAYENGRWNCVNATFCFFSDLDTDHKKWHELTTELLDMIKERE
jgi:hypothetical protein